MILLSVLILTSISTLLVSVLLLQTIVQQRIVYNYHANWATLRQLEDDLSRLLNGEELIHSQLYVLASTTQPNGVRVADVLLIHTAKAKYQLKISLKYTPGAKTRIIDWKF